MLSICNVPFQHGYWKSTNNVLFTQFAFIIIECLKWQWFESGCSQFNKFSLFQIRWQADLNYKIKIGTINDFFYDFFLPWKLVEVDKRRTTLVFTELHHAVHMQPTPHQQKANSIASLENWFPDNSASQAVKTHG